MGQKGEWKLCVHRDFKVFIWPVLWPGAYDQPPVCVFFSLSRGGNTSRSQVCGGDKAEESHGQSQLTPNPPQGKISLGGGGYLVL